MTKEEQRFTAAVAAMQGMLSNPEIMRAKLDFFKYQTVDNCIKMSIQYSDALMKEMDNKAEENEPLPAYSKDLFANSKNGYGKKTHDVIVADTVVTKANPDARVVTKTQIIMQNRNSIQTTPDPITEPSMNSIGDIKLRK